MKYPTESLPIFILGLPSIIFPSIVQFLNEILFKCNTSFSFLVTKPCFSSKNKCSHLCLKSLNDSIKCDCPTGMVAVSGTNGKNCSAAEYDFQIYFVDSYSESVNRVTKYKGQVGFTIKPLPIPSNESLDYPLSLDVHLKSKSIYWTDHGTKKV